MVTAYVTFHRALVDGSQMASSLPNDDLAQQLAEDAENFRSAMTQQFWDETKAYSLIHLKIPPCTLKMAARLRSHTVSSSLIAREKSKYWITSSVTGQSLALKPLSFPRTSHPPCRASNLRHTMRLTGPIAP